MPNPTFSTPRILIVDDTLANARLLSIHLENAGYACAHADGGEAAFAQVSGWMPDLILLDVMMPGLDGYETCRRLKQLDGVRDVPVIFMSALSEKRNKLAGFQAGGVDYLTKPLEMEEVLARIRIHLSLRSLRKQLELQNRQLQQQIAIRHEVEEALQQAYASLEERVRQRTAELARTTASLQAENQERRQAEQRLTWLAHYDTLTGLPNRVLLQDRIRQAISYADRNGCKAAVLFLDVDYFKHVNDFLGHDAGDRLLQTVAARLLGCLRQGDSVARPGGDEFVLCLPLVDSAEAVVAVAQKILSSLNHLFVIDGHELHLSATIGISLYPGDAADAEGLLRAADSALYHAKERGRSSFQFFTSALNKAGQRRLALTNRLRRALMHEEFRLHFQPQVDLGSGRIVACEALLRHQRSGHRQPISCGPLMPVAEETGLIVPIGAWVLREACRQMRSWREMGFEDMRVAVNLSARQFHAPGFEDSIVQLLDEFDLPASALDLELTENLLLKNDEDNVSTMHRLSGMGVQLSIDDFGTGYSSLSYLQRFPIHALKIDRAFISGIGQDENNTALVTAIIAMARSLKLHVMAEGVESREQADFLRRHGCPSAQGWYYGKAVPADILTGLLARQAAGGRFQ